MSESGPRPPEPLAPETKAQQLLGGSSGMEMCEKDRLTFDRLGYE